MKRIFLLSLLFLCVNVVYGATKCDSIRVYFELNKANYNPTLDNNASLMDKFINALVAASREGALNHVEVYGYASPDGIHMDNDRLAAARCKSISNYISRHAGIPMADIHTYPGSVDWRGLRDLVMENGATPDRDKVLRILNEYIPYASTDSRMAEQCKQSLLALDEGRTYKWMLDRLFPKLRYSLAVYTYLHEPAKGEKVQHLEDNKGLQGTLTPESAPLRIAIDDKMWGRLPLKGDMLSADSISIKIPSTIGYHAHTPFHRLAVKTNLLYDAALVPNLEVEWLINHKWSVALEGDVAWWKIYAHEPVYRLVMISPEVKRRIRPRAPWHGFYVGLFAGAAFYDFEKRTHGYRGEGYMGGLSIGYMWPVSRCLSLEAALGAGYLYSRYKEYRPIEGHHVYQRTKEINYFGPLKVKFSLVWRLWDRKKSARPKTSNSGIQST